MAASAETSGESIRRGCAISTGNSATTRPGRLESSTMRSPSRAASRTLWVTKTTVSSRSRDDALQLVVEHVARHRVQRPERLVHQQDVAVLAEGARQRDPLAHATGQLVRALAREVAERARHRAAPRPSAGVRPSRRRAAAARARRWLPPSATGRAPPPGTSARGAGRRSRPIPPSAESSPEMIESSVLLPQPDAPTRQTNSPRPTVERELVEGDDRSAVDLRDLVQDHRRLDLDAGRPRECAVGRHRCLRGERHGCVTSGEPLGLEDLVQQLEVVDSRGGCRPCPAGPRRSACSAPVISVAGSGSSVKVSVFHAWATSSGSSGLPVSLPIAVVDHLLRVRGVGVHGLVGGDLALEQRLDDVGVLLEELGAHDAGGSSRTCRSGHRVRSSTSTLPPSLTSRLSLGLGHPGTVDVPGRERVDGLAVLLRHDRHVAATLLGGLQALAP